MAWNKQTTEKLLELYAEGWEPDELAVEFARSKTSIINKLVKEKVYRKPPEKEVVTKKMLVRRLNKVMGAELYSAEKMNKNELLWLVEQLESIYETFFENR